MWQLRKGLAATTGAMRPSGTAFLTEDVAVPVARLAEAILDFQALFERHGVPDTVIFGHAKDGNLHFVLAEDVRSPEAVERYGAFVQGLVDIVVHKYDGAIKAEHGSGRNMAPFVKTEWGERAYGVMERVKAPPGPRGPAEPRRAPQRQPAGAPREPQALPDHLAPRRPLHGVRLLRAALSVAGPHPHPPAADRGDPGDRAAARPRGSPGTAAWAESLEADFEYEGVTTCATDSMCQAACPVKIDTGALVKELRTGDVAGLGPAGGDGEGRALRPHVLGGARGPRAGRAG